ncbi:MAG TPA: molybdenum cofactor guanylyltransferase, partial [Solirubrobacterales bacterium]
LPAVDAIVAILAGGRSSRMGAPKTMAELGGRPLLSYPIAAALAVDLEGWVVAKRETELPALDCPVLIEPDEPAHALAGVLAALREAGGRGVVAVAGDMPFVEDKLIAWLASHPGTVAIEAAGRLQPLLARYDPAEAGALAEAVERGDSARDALRSLGPKIVGEDGLRRFGDPERICFNVNTPQDLERAERLVAAGAQRP